MKFKVTNKQVKEQFTNIKSTGYCGLVHLLTGVEPIAYTCGIYGWNYDIYTVHGLTICTGYRNMPGEKLQQVSEYEQKAREIMNNYDISYDERKRKINELLK